MSSNVWESEPYLESYEWLLENLPPGRARGNAFSSRAIRRSERKTLAAISDTHKHNEELLTYLERKQGNYSCLVDLVSEMGCEEEAERLRRALLPPSPQSPQHLASASAAASALEPAPPVQHTLANDTTTEVQQGLRDTEGQATVVVNAVSESGIRQRRSHRQQRQAVDQALQDERPPLLQEGDEQPPLLQEGDEQPPLLKEGDRRPPQHQVHQPFSCCGIRLWWWLLLALVVAILSVQLESLHVSWNKGPWIASDILPWNVGVGVSPNSAHPQSNDETQSPDMEEGEQEPDVDQHKWTKVPPSPLQEVASMFETAQHPDGTWYATALDTKESCVIYSTRDFIDWYPVGIPDKTKCGSLVAGEAGVFMIATYSTNRTHRFLCSVANGTVQQLDSVAATSILFVAGIDHVILVSPDCGPSYCPAYVISERKLIKPSSENCRAHFCLVPGVPNGMVNPRFFIVGGQLVCIPDSMKFEYSRTNVFNLSEASGEEQSQWIDITLTGSLPEVKPSPGVVARGSGIIVAGGWTIGDETDVYATSFFNSTYFLDIATNNTIQLPELPFQRAGVSLAIHDGYLYCIGGFSWLDGKPKWHSDIHRLKLYP